MSENSARPPWKKRILLIIGGLCISILLFVLAIRLTVTEMFRGIEQSRSTGLSAVAPWGTGVMLQKGVTSGDYDRFALPSGSQISRSADLRTHSSAFDRSVATLHQIASSRHGFLEDLRTESRSGQGRALAALVTVPSNEFDAALSDLKTLGRIEAVSEAGEDSAVKLATAARRLTSAQTSLSRLQKLQRERKGELRDAVALEKDIAQANEAVVEAERQHESLVSTVMQARINVILIEGYRAPLEANLAGTILQLRNSLIEGVSAAFSSATLILGVSFEYGLPILFWFALLFWPLRAAWRRFRRTPAAVAAVS
jgi:hypothetical protein